MMNRRVFLISTSGATLAAMAHAGANAPFASGPFIDRLLPAPKAGGFAMDDYWIGTGGDIVRGDDDRYHMITCRFPKAFPFYPYWVTNYEVVRAVAERPEGPYQFAEIIREDRPKGAEHWNGMAIYSPSIQRHGEQWLMFYTGTTYTGDRPTPEDAVSSGTQQNPRAKEGHARQQIGLATAPSIRGPWTHRKEPVLSPRPGHWDSYMVSNPAPCVLEDGSCLLVYKSMADVRDTMKLGVARADHFGGPYKRLTDKPIFNFRTDQPVEDPFVWWNGRSFEVLLRDWLGNICGEIKAGVHGTSDDGIHWELSEKPKAWSKTIQWDDGTRTTMNDMEAPKLFFENGVPALLTATVREGGTRNQPDKLRIVVIPLRR